MKVCGLSTTVRKTNIKIYTIDGIIETNLKLAFFFFEEGIVLKTNKTNYNLFGEEIDSYFSNITKTKFSTNSKKNALIFEDYKNLYDYLIKNKKIFIDMVKNYEYQFEIELVSIRDFLPKGDVLIVERLIEEINSNIGRKAKTEQEICEEIKQEKFFGPLPLQEKVSLEEMIVEAEKRLKYMNILDVYVSNFKREKNIYQSQMNGIIHNLDDCSKNISKKLLEDGYLPYHIVISKNNIGKTYNVLYVSRCPKNWNKERLNNKGYIVCYCFDNSTNFDNFETIQLTKTNGGLIRIN